MVAVGFIYEGETAHYNLNIKVKHFFPRLIWPIPTHQSAQLLYKNRQLWRVSEIREASQPRVKLLLMLCITLSVTHSGGGGGEALSTLSCIHDLTETQDWLVSL